MENVEFDFRDNFSVLYMVLGVFGRLGWVLGIYCIDIGG